MEVFSGTNDLLHSVDFWARALRVWLSQRIRVRQSGEVQLLCCRPCRPKAQCLYRVDRRSRRKLQQVLLHVLVVISVAEVCGGLRSVDPVHIDIVFMI